MIKQYIFKPAFLASLFLTSLTALGFDCAQAETAVPVPATLKEQPAYAGALSLNLAEFKFSQAHARDLIAKTNQTLDLELDFLLAAVIHKDLSKSSLALKKRIEKGWQLSFQPHWESRFFPQVFHSWFYLQGLQGLDALSQKHLQEIERKIIQETASLRVELPEQEPALAPIFDSHSGQKSHYTVYLSQARHVQAVLKTLNNPAYEMLYRASASQASLEEHERWALATLLEEPGAQLAATAVWRHYQSLLESGTNKVEAFDLASKAVEQTLTDLVHDGDLASELLSVINWNTGFRPEEVFFLSGDYLTTALYGSVIFIAQQQRQRGIPLNEYGHQTGFYQQLPYEWLLSVKGFWLFAVADKAEYLLPTYLDHSEIIGVDVRAERKVFSAEATRTGAPGVLLRKYRKYYDPNLKQLFVYVLDAQDHWIGTFYRSEQRGISNQALLSVPQQDWPLAKQVLPDSVLQELPEGVVYLKASSHL